MRNMKYILAVDSFKGCLTSMEVEQVLGEALREQGATVVALPMSDGGEGMLEAFTLALGGRIEKARVHDPLMRPITAEYGIAPDGTAIIETSKACGLTLMAEDERNPWVATSYGVGELVAQAARQGARDFIIGLGGSGTSDAGIGMLRALTDAFAKGGTMGDALAGALRGCRFRLASDVRNPLCGERGAAQVFGRQKGATEEMVAELDARARRFAEISARHFGFDRSQDAGAGAAGGLGYAFLQYLDAKAQSGADLLLDLIDFDRIIADADVVVTGEGRADRQTLMGKLPERVLQRARKHGVGVWLMAGQVADKDRLLQAGFAKVESITPEGLLLQEAMKPDVARANIRRWATAAIGRKA